ncbi:MAG: hypothetical protein KF760_29145 [Candidatus Eremiobacteraeota bacterium]|nr:hypothetical protein [Candidatus Eremiobacteraeota bacterium]MCW5865960.1 hypothetical protein [Candidatus Eremiobacteraeota bacterium]
MRQRARDERWCKVDREWLRNGTWLARVNEVIHGPSAEFHQDGQLRRLAIYCNGRLSQSHSRLELELGIPEGSVIGDGVLCTFSYGWEEVHLCFEGDAETYAEPAVWDDWVRKWIDQICAGERVHLLET